MHHLRFNQGMSLSKTVSTVQSEPSSWHRTTSGSHKLVICLHPLVCPSSDSSTYMKKIRVRDLVSVLLNVQGGTNYPCMLLRLF